MLNKGADGIDMVINYQKYILKPRQPCFTTTSYTNSVK